MNLQKIKPVLTPSKSNSLPFGRFVMVISCLMWGFGNAQVTEFKVLASDGAAGDRFGYAVSISGDYALVGAYWDDANGFNSGSAFVFRREGSSWLEEPKLLASDGSENDQFGISVSISGDYAIVGASGDDDNGNASGAAYVFRRDGKFWIQETKLIASNGLSMDLFGEAVAIDGDYAIVGAWSADPAGTNSGAAYIFKREAATWSQEAILHPSDGQANENFGGSVALSGDYAIVGAWLGDDSGTQSGSAYVFKREGSDWLEETNLIPDGGASGDFFGESVAIDGSYAIVGAPGDHENAPSSGSAYIFRREGDAWVEDIELTAFDWAGQDEFGYAVSMSGDYALVGAHQDDDFGSSSGSAYIFRNTGDTWTEITKLVASDGAPDDKLGSSVGIYGGYGVVGAPFDDDHGGSSGSAYVFGGIGSSVILNPIPLDFGGVLVGEELVDSLSIINVDSSEITIQAINIAGEDPENFSADTTLFALASGDTGIIAVVFAPDEVASFSAALDIETSVETVGVSLFGSGQSILDFTPLMLEFDTTLIGGQTTEILTLSNIGSINISVLSITISGADTGSFNVDTTLFDIASGESHKLQVSFSPNQHGNYSSYLEILTSGGDAEISLSGVGLLESSLQEVKLTPDDGSAEDKFGQSVSLSGDLAVVGAYLDDDKGTNSGSAYVFRHHGKGWEQEAKLTAPDGAAGDFFGFSVSLSGNYALVGAYLDDDKGTDSGSAYVFAYDGQSWMNMSKLIASDGWLSDRFGYAVSISGDYALIGAYWDDIESCVNCGSAYVFRREGQTWVEEAKLTAAEGGTFSEFGNSVFIHGNYALVGAHRSDSGVTASGAAHVFHMEGDNWVEEAKLLASDREEHDAFGHSVALFEDFALIGATGDDDSGSASGSVYIFKRTGTKWVEEAKLISFDAAEEDQFGYSVSIYGNYALIGARNDDDFGTSSGSAYLFRNNGDTWSLVTKAIASDAASDDNFGSAVGMHESFGIVGAPNNDDLGDDLGSAYVYSGFDATVIAQESDGAELPLDFRLEPNYPNPFNPSTTIRYDLPVASKVTLRIYNILGQRVWEFVERRPAGYHDVVWNGINAAGEQVASGIYLYQMRAGEFVQTRKMLLAR